MKGKSGQGALALEATSGLVDALASWFGIPYPYDKLDIVAVPDFAAGAMENAGLVTFREELLLLDPARASVRARRSQALVIAHELAHQWFGDLVTAAWWDDLWLNEGFATWMEWRIVDQWKPSFGARTDAVVDQLGVMDLDALASARAVRQPVVSTSEAQEAFDGITYEKGAAVLSTIERWIGEEAFQRGVRDYLTSNAFQSVHADRLLRVARSGVRQGRHADGGDVPRSRRRSRGDRAHRVRSRRALAHRARPGAVASARLEGAGGSGARVDDPRLRAGAGREEAAMRGPRVRRAVDRRRVATARRGSSPTRRAATTGSRSPRPR